MDINSQAFRWWLTGISDGESNFNIQYISVPRRKKDSPYSVTWRMQWRLTLRADDRKVIELVHSFTGGIIQYNKGSRQGQNPTFMVTVSAKKDLLRLVDHFERFPLASKKARDFAVWAEAVRAWHEAPVVNLGFRKGSKKSDATHARVLELHDALKSYRPFDAELSEAH